jgi:HPt (histidine-containing phosphotransfer) domain-containing protein
MIDWDRLHELRTEIGEEDFCEVVKMFLEEIAEVLERISRDNGDANAADFHFLRGSATNLGFRGFAKKCSEAEVALTQGRKADLNVVSEIYVQSLVATADVLPRAEKVL